MDHELQELAHLRLKAKGLARATGSGIGGFGHECIPSRPRAAGAWILGIRRKNSSPGCDSQKERDQRKRNRGDWLGRGNGLFEGGSGNVADRGGHVIQIVPEKQQAFHGGDFRRSVDDVACVCSHTRVQKTEDLSSHEALATS